MNFRAVVIIVFTILSVSPDLFSQNVSSIPESRKTDWARSGYMRKASDNLPGTGYTIVPVGLPTGSPSVDYINIENAVNTASALSAADNLVVVKFFKGTYVIDKPIKLGLGNKYLIFSGEGTGRTFINMSPAAGTSTIIEINGAEETHKYQIQDYNRSDNSIVLSEPAGTLQAGDYIDIQVPDGSWKNSQNAREPDLLGQVVRIKQVKGAAEFILEDDFSLVWDLAFSESKTPYLHKVLLVENIGFEKFTAEPLTDKAGNIFTLDYAKDIWFREIETVNAVNAHFQISHSTQIELRRNFIHHAQNYGVGGHGYGVELIRRTTNSLIEDNIFQSLRHAMMVARGASRNVFGYNYSREQKDEVGNVLSDINLHGNFPFLNLFEGNRVDRIEADDYHGSNGYYNTFIRNYSYYRELKIKSSDNFNLIANEAKLTSVNSSGHVDEYDQKRSHGKWKPSYYLKSVHSGVSGYHTDRPSFLINYAWPPVGPRSSNSGKAVKHDIPARDRFCEANTDSCEAA